MNILDVYSFVPGLSYQGKVTIPGQYPLHRFALVLNVTRGVIMYDPQDYKKNANWSYDATANETTLVFEAWTDGFDSGDEVQILVYAPEGVVGSGPASNVAVTNFPISQTINGSVSILGEVEVSNDLNNPLPVIGDVNVLNEVEIKNDLNNPITVAGTVSIDSSQTLPVTVSYPPGSTGGFGENLVSEITPVTQLEAIYGTEGDMSPEYESFSSFGGFGGTEDGMFVARSSAVQFSYGVFRSNRFLRYRPGLSATGRFTAMFTPNVIGSEQRAGLFNQESAFMVGYKDDQFGILHSYGAKAAIITIVVTSAPTTSGNAIIVLNGIGYTVPLVSGEDTVESAARIASFGFPGWNAQQADNVVTLISLDTQPRSGIYTFTSTVASGTVSQVRIGVPPTDVWIPQTSWNVDTLLGSGPSGMTLRPQFLNVFQIRYKWLGVGSISFMIEDQVSGKNIEFHKIIWTNQNTIPHVANPSFKIGYVAYNLSSPGASVEVKGSSMMMGVDGKKVVNHYPRSFSVIKNGLSNDNIDPDDIHHIITVLNPLVVNNKINTRELILNTASLSSVASDPTNFLIYLDADLLGGQNHLYRSLPQTNALVCTVDGYIDGTLFTPLITSALVGGGQTGGQKDIDFKQYDIVVPAGSRISICARSSTNITELSAALTWTVD